MVKKYVYLAGPIEGCDEDEANGWRLRVQNMLPHNIVGISPLRCEPLKEICVDKMWTNPRAISTKNWYDTENCDLILAYLPKKLNERRPSIGTIIEIGWAIGLRKPLIIVSDDNYLINHPLIKDNSSWCLTNIDDAVEVIIGLFGDYVN